MKERTITAVSLIALCVIGVAALLMAHLGQGDSSRFLLALFPLLVVLVGVALLRQSGLTMAVVGLVLTALLAVLEFGTTTETVLQASAVGFLKSFGISVAVPATMLMIFLMRETGALQTVSKVVKRQVLGDEMQALYIGIGFGSFLTSLGVVTPALFPPLLATMGFTPSASVAIAVLGYDPTTSFSLLSIPITLPASQFGLNPLSMAFKVAIFLPLISTGFGFAILWLVGGRESMRKGAVPALVSSLALAFACLGTVSLDYFTGVEFVPLRIVGVVAGLSAMASLYLYQWLSHTKRTLQKPDDYPDRKEVVRSFSPWIILTILAAIISVQPIGTWLSNVLGAHEEIVIPVGATSVKVDLDVLSQIYTWILVAVLFSLLTLKPSREQVKKAFGVWVRRFPGPFLCFALYFCMAFVMNFSTMNIALGATLASVFGAGYVFVAASLGLFGAIVGGSETTSNILFYQVQRTAYSNLQLSNPALSENGFMTVYGSHAAAGGIASAVTPAKINNAVVTIDARKDTESLIMRKHLIVAVLLTIATGILTGILVNLGM